MKFKKVDNVYEARFSDTAIRIKKDNEGVWRRIVGVTYINRDGEKRAKWDIDGVQYFELLRDAKKERVKVRHLREWIFENDYMTCEA